MVDFARSALSPETGQVAVAQIERGSVSYGDQEWKQDILYPSPLRVGQSRAPLAEAAQTWQLAA